MIATTSRLPTTGAGTHGFARWPLGQRGQQLSVRVGTCTPSIVHLLGLAHTFTFDQCSW